ncbi:hypothetical protein [Stieleria mannarensis]|uniref:hypothetical protein n=1 Tax=Stieleria mannarensis TaxID=2755585 RepID=UPI0015FF1BD0|nr:hypothetical protein [Rhodopirellula sp. JC639]
MNIRHLDLRLSTFGYLCCGILLSTLLSAAPPNDKGKPPKDDPPPSSGGPVSYRAVVIPNPYPADLDVRSINAWGEVCGDFTYDGLIGGYTASEAFYWDGRDALTSVADPITLNELVDVLSPGSRDGWLITHAEDINDLGQTCGWTFKDGQWSPYLFDPNAVAPASPFIVLTHPTGLENAELGALSLNNSGDMVVQALKSSGEYFLYSTTTQTWTPLQTPVSKRFDSLSNRDPVTNTVYVIGGPGRMLIDPDTGQVFPSADVGGISINDYGTMVGTMEGSKGVRTAVYEYTDSLEILKNGRKDLDGRAPDNNNSGDISMHSPNRLFTRDHGLLDVNSLLDPVDAAIFPEGVPGSIWAISERTEVGFPQLLLHRHSIDAEPYREGVLLIPQPPSN